MHACTSLVKQSIIRAVFILHVITRHQYRSVLATFKMTCQYICGLFKWYHLSRSLLYFLDEVSVVVLLQHQHVHASSVYCFTHQIAVTQYRITFTYLASGIHIALPFDGFTHTFI